jgi:glucose-1-phosphate cytidylyltransferase
MKVVLFCGGLGLRLRDFSEAIPKPMVPVGCRPILWHIMKYYAHFGHKDFILCLGWRGDVIKNYFLNYNECLSNDFTLSAAGVTLRNRDIQDWNIVFADTGMTSNIGGRLKAVERYLDGEEVFLANYADNVADFHLPDLTDFFLQRQAAAAFLSVHPAQSFHPVSVDCGGHVQSIRPVRESDMWINGGFFVFRREIFNYMRDGEELVEEPFRRLIAEQKLVSLRHDGFWACMDTYKEKQMLDDLDARGDAPWQVWKKPRRMPRGPNAATRPARSPDVSFITEQ